ncbi:NAD(+)/NADH kinase [candidate division KSB1 bacterium]
MKFGVSGNIQNEKIREAVLKAIKSLDSKNISYVIDEHFSKALKLDNKGIPKKDLGRLSDLILAFGGDGTLLYIAKEIGDCKTPILGINTGHLGFLTEIMPEEFPQKIDFLLSGEYSVEKRTMIESFVSDGPSNMIYAVNDFTIEKGSYPRTIKIAIIIEDEYCHTYTSNGIIVSTATGSTAFSLSAGGPIVYPTIKDILITPICPHTLSARPMVIPEEFKIEFELISGPDEVPLIADGQFSRMLSPGQKITIRKSKSVLNLIHFPSHSFFRVLSSKLGWGTRNENQI